MSDATKDSKRLVEELREFSDVIRKHGAHHVADCINTILEGKNWRKVWEYHN